MTSLRHALPTITSARLRTPAILATVWLVFGSATVAGKIGVTSVPPFLFAGTRFVVAGLLLLAWAAWRGGWRLALRPPDVLSAGLVGVALILGGQGGTMWAVQYMPPGLVAVLTSLVPAWVALLSLAVLRQRIGLLTALGVAAGFVGVILLAAPAGGGRLPTVPALVVVGASLSWAVGSLYGSRAGISRRPLVATGLQLLVGGALQLVLGVALGEPAQLHTAALAGPAVLAWTWLLVGPSLVGFPLFTWLMANTPPSVANAQAYVAPVVALGLAWLLLGEPLLPRTVVAAAVALAGVALIVTAAGRQREDPAPALQSKAA